MEYEREIWDTLMDVVYAEDASILLKAEVSRQALITHVLHPDGHVDYTITIPRMHDVVELCISLAHELGHLLDYKYIRKFDEHVALARRRYLERQADEGDVFIVISSEERAWWIAREILEWAVGDGYFPWHRLEEYERCCISTYKR